MARDVPYGVELIVGPYTWELAQSDTLALPCPVDGLQIIRKLVESDLWPPVEDVRECRFQLVAATAADLAGIEVGSVVSVAYEYGFTGTGIVDEDESFHGRVAELTMDPHDLGVIFTVSCLDFTADLRELDVGLVDYPAENILQRLQRILVTELGYDLVVDSEFWLETPPMLTARTASPTKAYDLVNHYLAQWPAEFEFISGIIQGPDRLELTADVDAVGGFVRWRLDRLTTDPSYDGPLKLADVGGLVTAVPDTNVAGTALLGVDGGDVEFSSSYAITKSDSINAVLVSGKGPGGGADYSVKATLGLTPEYVATLSDVELSDPGAYAKLAAMYLPSGVGDTRWVADEFTWLLELTEPSIGRHILGDLRSLVLVGNLQEARNPNGDAWYAGLVASYTFTVANKRPFYVFQLRRPDFGSAEAGDVITWNDTQLAGVTWDDLNPADSWADYRLVRGA